MNGVVNKFSLFISIAAATLAYIHGKPYTAIVLLALAAISISNLSVEQIEKIGNHPKEILEAALRARASNLLAYVLCAILLAMSQDHNSVAIFGTLGALNAVITVADALVAIERAQASEQSFIQVK